MNLIQQIANRVEARIEERSKQSKAHTGKGFGTKTQDNLAFELWCGASLAVDALEGENSENAQWVRRVVVLLIATRGYGETQKLAREGREADEQAAVDAAKYKEVTQ